MILAPIPDDHYAGNHLAGHQSTGHLGLRRNVAEPGRREHGDCEDKASVRVIGSLKLPAETTSMMKFVATNNSGNSGGLVARAPTARSAGYGALMIERDLRG
jgi:hypothetical protein